MRNKSHLGALATLVAATSCALLAAGAAAAHRLPTPPEQQALTGTVAAWLTRVAPAFPIGCLDLRFAVSTVDSRYAITTRTVSVRADCARYRGNGAEVLRRDSSGWRIIYEGSDPPRCSVKYHYRGDGSDIPPAVTRDLFGVPCLRA